VRPFVLCVRAAFLRRVSCKALPGGTNGGNERESRPFVVDRSALPAGQTRWALRDSNPRPSPCKGDRNVQVSGLTSGNVVTLGTSEYLGVTLSRGAGVVQRSRGESQLSRSRTRVGLAIGSPWSNRYPMPGSVRK
jgi:hypothetical protein